jgi:O-antigen/teichoic acid export membrane protein
LPAISLLVYKGPVHAAAASLISCTAIIPVELWFLRAGQGLQLTAYFRALVAASVASTVMALVTFGVVQLTSELLPPAQLIVCCIAGAGAYVVALRTLAPGAFRRCRDLAMATFRKKARSS